MDAGPRPSPSALARLATDGGSGPRLPSRDAAERDFQTFAMPLDTLRAIAHRHEVRLTDVLMSVTAGSVRRVLGDAAPATLRITTPLMVRAADSSAEGNLTAAVMTTVPLAAMSETERLLDVGRAARRTERGTRALASRFVMTHRRAACCRRRCTRGSRVPSMDSGFSRRSCRTCRDRSAPIEWPAA